MFFRKALKLACLVRFLFFFTSLKDFRVSLFGFFAESPMVFCRIKSFTERLLIVAKTLSCWRSCSVTSIVTLVIFLVKLTFLTKLLITTKLQKLSTLSNCFYSITFAVFDLIQILSLSVSN